MSAESIPQAIWLALLVVALAMPLAAGLAAMWCGFMCRRSHRREIAHDPT